MSKSDLNTQPSISKNSIALVFRMLLRLLVSLYTTRVILNALGVDDYGIYNVIAGFSVMFSFVNTSMSTAISRFLAFDLGNGKDEASISNTFRLAFTSQVLLAIIVFILAEAIGIPIINNYLTIPVERIFAANILYQCTLVSLVLNMLQVPFNAAIIAFERMTAYAYIEIVYVILLLGIAFILQCLEGSLLIYYGLMLVGVNLMVFMSYLIYTRRFKICTPRILFNWASMKPMIIFSGADFYSNCSLSLQSQGQNIIINRFFGLVANASVGIASQVYGALLMFSSSITTAIRPRVIKLYAAEEKTLFLNLICDGSSVISFFNVIVCIPTIFLIKWILPLWLESVPAYATLFTQILLINHCLFSYKPILIAGLHASGKITGFSFISGTWFILAILIQYAIAYIGMDIVGVFGLIIVLTGVNIAFIVYYLNKLVNLPVKQIIRKVILPTTLIVILSLTIGYFLTERFGGELSTEIEIAIGLFFFSGVLSTVFILNSRIRSAFINLIKELKCRFIGKS